MCIDIDVCEVTRSRKGKKKVVTPVSTLRMNLNDEDTTVSSVSRSVAAEAFDGQPVVLLNNKNLPILDSPVTRSKRCMICGNIAQKVF